MLRDRRQHRLDPRWHRAFARTLHFCSANRSRTALRWRLLGNFFDRPTGQDRAVVLLDVPLRIFGRVLMFDQQPLVALFAALQLDQHEAAAQLLPVQAEFNLAALQLLHRIERRCLRLVRVRFQHKRSAVPHHHTSRAVVAFGDFPLEAAILQRMILRLHRQAFIRMAQRRPLRHRPRFQRTVNRQPEVVVQPRRGVLLHHKGISIFVRRARFQPQLRLRLRQTRALARLRWRSRDVASLSRRNPVICIFSIPEAFAGANGLRNLSCFFLCCFRLAR